jgi:hypothetical protein
LILLGLGSLLPACSSTKALVTKNNAGKLFAVSSDKTSFYRYGPQQGNGPDESLPKDTLMTLIRPSFGYCKVQLVGNSKEGYVASEDIKPAPPTLVAALTAPAHTSGNREDLDVRSTEPPPPESLPDPDLPPPSPEASPQ